MKINYMEKGYIKIWRKIQEWEWYDDSLTVWFFIKLIMMANWEEKKWHGMIIKRGQFISSYENLRFKNGVGKNAKRLTTSVVRTLISRLKLTGELTSESTNQFTLYTIEKYSTYQDSSLKITDETTSKDAPESQASRKRVATTKELISIKALKEEAKASVYEHTRNGVYAHVKDTFSTIWNMYPKKLGKKHAERHFNASVKSIQDFENIKKALNNYISSMAGKDPKYIKHGGTWFNEWQDWVDYKEVSNEPGRRMLE